VDSDQFDALVSRLSSQLTRRRSLGLLGVAAVTGAGLVEDADAKKKKKRRKKPKPKPGKPPTTQPPPPPGPCQSSGACDRCARETCESGVCTCRSGMGRDANGICGNPTGCAPVNTQVANPAVCCSGQGIPINGPNGLPLFYICQRGTTRCLTTNDCTDGPCRGFLCPTTYLAEVGQQCAARTAERPDENARHTRRRR
jgi:hypothetical protein